VNINDVTVIHASANNRVASPVLILHIITDGLVSNATNSVGSSDSTETDGKGRHAHIHNRVLVCLDANATMSIKQRYISFPTDISPPEAQFTGLAASGESPPGASEDGLEAEDDFEFMDLDNAEVIDGPDTSAASETADTDNISSRDDSVDADNPANSAGVIWAAEDANGLICTQTQIYLNEGSKLTHTYWADVNGTQCVVVLMAAVNYIVCLGCQNVADVVQADIQAKAR
jgi:hypothetical protein